MNTIRKVEFDNNELTVYFAGSDEPFGIRDFKEGSVTRLFLESIEADIAEFNNLAVKK